MSILSDLLSRALQVKQETVEEANSSLRVGSLFYDIINFFSTGSGAVLYVEPQTLTIAQKLQALANIDASKRLRMNLVDFIEPTAYAPNPYEAYLTWYDPVANKFYQSTSTPILSWVETTREELWTNVTDFFLFNATKTKCYLCTDNIIPFFEIPTNALSSILITETGAGVTLDMSKDIIRINSTSGTADIALTAFSNMPTSEKTNLVTLINSRGASMNVVLRTADLVVGANKYKFVNFDATTAAVANAKRIDVSYVTTPLGGNIYEVSTKYSAQV